MSHLYIIATPIGNMEDITLRASRILKNEVDLIFCEDTRQTRKLLNHLGINLPLISLHSHSPESKILHAINELKKGSTVAYLTDAGTPGISDPGSRLVREAVKNNYAVTPLPGPSALTAALSISGFPEKEVIFTGFLSKKEGKRINELKALAEFEGLLVIYESPHRIIKMLHAINEVFPDKEILIAREITKIHEEFIRGTAHEILSMDPPFTQKGEFTLVIRNKKARS
ncbi:MAG TPA: 16S rRNA (cytidine(1402)-2'-O)-methyltransferase [Spirochaetota bacterium]|nr:16S rRNA (cytidine(1402)-2'-O)-methyltransferase [Spirochaetota bacterium]HPI88603.1 16S rRNA (cytidine(1402)-2'-O)-methyltransferase [Spirochaetota bacterium]HPR48244.1 16S rRNA (cytidine(1402)-2'-O)-methyltransferase [Spirochaetota bacterium]